MNATHDRKHTLVIIDPTTLARQVVYVDQLDLQTMQAALGGNLEFVGTHHENGLTIYCDEDSRQKYVSTSVTRTLNRKLSVILGERCPTVVGPVLITCTDDDGESVMLTDTHMQLISSHFPVC